MRFSPSLLLTLASADIYMHMPRGSNNRLNEKSTSRSNGNRLFDSQNNSNGGYNVADAGAEEAGSMSEQHAEIYIQSGKIRKSHLNIEWVNQHGCGKLDDDDANAVDCHVVIQYKCGGDQLRNGMSIKTPQFTRPDEENSSMASTLERKKGDVDVNTGKEDEERGEHETWENYDSCHIRNRNGGLFLADQQLRGSSSIYTRQNPDGQQRGYECPEERDYFPYWHPTEWTDVAVLTSNVESCDYYRNQSSNRLAKSECVELNQNGARLNHASRANNQAECAEIEHAEWIEFYDYMSIVKEIETEDYCHLAAKSAQYDNHTLVWAYPRQIGAERYDAPEKACLVLHPDIDCQLAPWSRANHLGNSNSNNDDFVTYRWELPSHFEEEKECILRMRYNISSDDYGEQFDAGDITTFYKYQTLQNDPVIMTKTGVSLQLALNTAQIGRTFQDRSHIFKLSPRSNFNIGDNEMIENLQVRGKRGNIVQTFPAVEYDFSPKRLEMDASTLLHIQWAGSNSNPHGNAGEGSRGTDRSNMVTMGAPNWNIPANQLEFSTVQSLKRLKKTWMIHRHQESVADASQYCESINMELAKSNGQDHELVGSLEGFMVTTNTSSDVETVCVRQADINAFDVNENEVGERLQNIEFVELEHDETVFWRVHQSKYRSFEQANNYCLSIGMQLPVPMTYSENQAFGSIKGGNFYLGISDRQIEGTFVNIYTNEPLPSSYWAPGEPNDSTRAILQRGFQEWRAKSRMATTQQLKNGEDYVMMRTNVGLWNDVSADLSNHANAQTVCVKQVEEEDLSHQTDVYDDMFDQVEWVWSSLDNGNGDIRQSNDNLAVQMASSGYYSCASGCDRSVDDMGDLQIQLNNAPASFHGNVIRFNRSAAGTRHWYFMSTRNNNFSNRAQKGDIKVIN